MRAIVVHGSFDDIGGAETYCFRVIEILQRRFEDVLVLHCGKPLNVERVEQWSNVAFDRRRVRFEAVAPGLLGRAIERLPVASLTQLKAALVYRRFQARMAGADLLVTTGNECTLHAKRIIQSIHFPQYICDLEGLSYLGWTCKSRLRHWLQIAYINIVRAMVGWNRKYIGSLLTVTNSEWTADQFRRHYPARDVRAFHSGVDVMLTPQSPEWVPFERREDNFVFLGRVTPEKGADRAVDIVSRLRAAGHDVGLHIIGKGSGKYADDLKHAISDKPWVHWHQTLNRIDVQKLIVSQKWGLHCFEYEHYGLAPGEMQALGCIAFVHDSGGQREIILNRAQRYTNVDDAVRKIDAVLHAPATHQKLMADGLENAKHHTIDGFRERFDALVSEVMLSDTNADRR